MVRLVAPEGPDKMFLGASKVVQIVMEGVTCGSTRYCHVDRHVEVHMGRHMGEGPHNALFSTYTCVQAEVDVLKISLKISQCGKDTCQWFKGASLPPRHLPCSMSFRGTFPTTYLLGSLGLGDPRLLGIHLDVSYS